MSSRAVTSTVVRSALGLSLVAALALAIGACDLVREVGARSWGMAATNQAGTEHTITVTDRSGLVADVEFAPVDANLFEPVTAVPGRPNALDVAWTGGSCDKTTTVDITKAATGLAVAVAIEDNGMPCDAMGLPQVVRLTFAEPVAPAAVKVTQ
jgi:hypothetical protein